jgi:hypothetical protein
MAKQEASNALQQIQHLARSTSLRNLYERIQTDSERLAWWNRKDNIEAGWHAFWEACLCEGRNTTRQVAQLASQTTPHTLAAFQTLIKHPQFVPQDPFHQTHFYTLLCMVDASPERLKLRECVTACFDNACRLLIMQRLSDPTPSSERSATACNNDNPCHPLSRSSCE